MEEPAPIPNTTVLHTSDITSYWYRSRRIHLSQTCPSKYGRTKTLTEESQYSHWHCGLKRFEALENPKKQIHISNQEDWELDVEFKIL